MNFDESGKSQFRMFLHFYCKKNITQTKDESDRYDFRSDCTRIREASVWNDQLKSLYEKIGEFVVWILHLRKLSAKWVTLLLTIVNKIFLMPAVFFLKLIYACRVTLNFAIVSSPWANVSKNRTKRLKVGQTVVA